MKKQTTVVNDTDDKKVVGSVDDERIHIWKQEHAAVFEITATEPDTGIEHKCYLRRPTRQELGYASKVGQTNPLGFNEAILRNCWLGGSDAIKDNDVLFMGVSAQLPDIIQVAEAAVKKL